MYINYLPFGSFWTFSEAPDRFDAAWHIIEINVVTQFVTVQNRHGNKVSSGKGITRPDMILANAVALRVCRPFRLRRDLTIKGHLGLQVHMSASNAKYFCHDLIVAI